MLRRIILCFNQLYRDMPQLSFCSLLSLFVTRPQKDCSIKQSTRYLRIHLRFSCVVLQTSLICCCGIASLHILYLPHSLQLATIIVPPMPSIRNVPPVSYSDMIITQYQYLVLSNYQCLWSQYRESNPSMKVTKLLFYR